MMAACASSPDNISSSYVSPLVYADYDCDQTREEMIRLQTRVAEVTGQQRKASRNDKIATGVGLVIFWPALFFLMSDSDKKDELARLKGEYEALQKAGISKKCFTSEELEAMKVDA